ncbi:MULTISPECIES: OsmC family protein [Micromonospora]|uniref:OsmC family protein n=1 Tax=Micromonospora TaxID=1873 RepID=UPI000E00ACB5|nr:OsmC family protein [Micromonospora provocatoris]RBJ09960.1 OsmC family peroxiredoxin [Micromonospora provocatoris]
MGQAGAQAVTGQIGTVDVRFAAGESYAVAVRGHQMLVDQPLEAGGDDAAPTPVELFVASLATCVAFYAGRYLTRHGLDRDGLGVSVTYRMAAGRPPRVADIRLSLRLPQGFPQARTQALLAVASHCTVHNSLTTPPAVTVDVL